jgi:hypothetical protein
MRCSILDYVQVYDQAHALTTLRPEEGALGFQWLGGLRIIRFPSKLYIRP